MEVERPFGFDGAVRRLCGRRGVEPSRGRLAPGDGTGSPGDVRQQARGGRDYERVDRRHATARSAPRGSGHVRVRGRDVLRVAEPFDDGARVLFPGGPGETVAQEASRPGGGGAAGEVPRGLMEAGRTARRGGREESRGEDIPLPLLRAGIRKGRSGEDLPRLCRLRAPEQGGAAAMEGSCFPRPRRRFRRRGATIPGPGAHEREPVPSAPFSGLVQVRCRRRAGGVVYLRVIPGDGRGGDAPQRVAGREGEACAPVPGARGDEGARRGGRCRDIMGARGIKRAKRGGDTLCDPAAPIVNEKIEIASPSCRWSWSRGTVRGGPAEGSWRDDGEDPTLSFREGHGTGKVSFRGGGVHLDVALDRLAGNRDDVARGPPPGGLPGDADRSGDPGGSVFDAPSSTSGR